MRMRMLGLIAPLVVAVATLITPATAWAGAVQIHDEIGVLDSSAVRQRAGALPVGVYIWVTTQAANSKVDFDNQVRGKVSAEFPVAMGINTVSHHESMQMGSRSGLSQSAARAAESNATAAFLSNIRSSHDYTSAVNAALDALVAEFRTPGHGQAPRQQAPARSSGAGALGGPLIVLALAALVVALLVARRRRRRPPSTPTAPPPAAGPYPDYGQPPGYQPRSGMSPGAAGALGALGGGLLGYELGKTQGEREQFRQDELADERDRRSDEVDQGDWVVCQDSDFDDLGANSDTSPDW